MNRSVLHEYFLTLLFVAVLAIYFSFPGHSDEEYSEILYEHLDSVLGDEQGVFLLGENVDYFVMRSLISERIEVYPADKELRLLLGRRETLKFSVSSNKVEISRARCIATKDYSVACESEGVRQKLWVRDLNKLFELINSAKDVGVVISQGGDRV